MNETTQEVEEVEVKEAPCYCFEREGDNDDCPKHGKGKS